MAVENVQHQGVSVLRAAGAMGIATFMSRIMGLVREQAFAILFGAGNATDAFNIAFRIPNLLRDLFAEGAMSAALVPTFTRVKTEEGAKRAWRLAGRVFRVLGVIVGLLSVLGVVFASELVSIYASAFQEIPGKFELTVTLTRIMFPFFPLVALAAAYMAILNACGKFFLPAFASALFNIASVVVGVAGALILPRFGFEPILGMAIGVVVGGAVQAFSQLPSLYRCGYQWEGPTPNEASWKNDPALKKILLLMIPGTIGLAATQINILVNSILATSQGPGAVSWLNYAFRLMQFPIGVFGVSLAAATLPTVSRLSVANDLEGIRTSLTQSLRHVFAVNLPASAGLAFLGYPIIQLIFEYGQFTASDTQATALALAMYSVGLTAYSAVKVLVPACYALGSSRIPVALSIASVGLNIGLNLLMVGPFGYWGLALGTSVTSILNAAFLVGGVRYLLQKRGGSFPVLPLVGALFIHLAVALTMGVACWLAHGWIDQFPIWRGLKVGAVIGVGVLIVVTLAQIFRIEDTRYAVNQGISLFRRKLFGKKP